MYNCCKTEEWDITNKPHTKTKTEIVKVYIQSWFTIWLNQYNKYSTWLEKRFIIIDLFAGCGKYYYNNNFIDGSPLIFLNTALENLEKIKNYNIKVEFYFIEKNKRNFQCLKNNISEFLKHNGEVENIFKINFFNEDCHNIYEKEILDKMNSSKPLPVFLFIDPYGINIKNELITQFLKTKHKIDILFNFMTMGVQRVKGAIEKPNYQLSKIKNTLEEFLGQKELNLIENMDEILRHFAKQTFSDKNFKVIIYDMPYPNKKGTLYHLLLSTKNENIIKVAERLFSQIKKKKQPSLFEHEFQKF